MMKHLHHFFLIIILFLGISFDVQAQVQRSMNSASSRGGGAMALRNSGTSKAKSDTVGHSKTEIPHGVYVWTVDKRFGDITRQPLDTIQHMYMNSVQTAGLRGEYNTIGNLGAPRIARIFADRPTDDGDFLFTRPYDFFRVEPQDFLFTNTLCPYANLTYNECGNKTNGEDDLRASYAVNVGKRFGFGFRIKYFYGVGYYNSQSSSLFNGSIFGSYIGDQYQCHLILGTNSQKMAENGGITDDMYITHPESFDDNFSSSEIPTTFERNWNRNYDKHVFLTQRYSVGFHRQVKMTEEEIKAKKFAMESQKQNEANELKKKKRHGEDDEDEPQTKYAGRPDNAKIAATPLPKEKNDSVAADTTRTVMTVDQAAAMAKQDSKEKVDTTWMKSEYVPVTSFIHTLQLDSHRRIYQAYETPTDFYTNDYFDDTVIGGDSVFDKTKFFRLRNTFAISMLEGFNKWMVAGIKLFAASDLRHYSLPNENGQLVRYNDNNVSIGGQLVRTQGKTLHYNVTAETWLLGDDQAQVKVDGNIDLNFPLFGDTVTLAAKGFFHNERPNYYLRHYHSRHFWWDDDLSMMTQTHLEGLFSYQKTRTTLRFAADELTNYTYLANSYETTSNGRICNNIYVRQASSPITVITAALKQDFTLGIINWENVVTYQKSTNQDALPVPALNIYTNLYLKFRIAGVLSTELGGDARYFTSYAAPDYAPALGQYAVQDVTDKTKIGNYPIVNLYANFNLKGTRFFILYSHANSGMGNRQAFLTPHYPINSTTMRFGVSWNFFN